MTISSKCYGIFLNGIIAYLAALKSIAFYLLFLVFHPIDIMELKVVHH